MSREQEITNRLCLLLGALAAVAPKDNDAMQDLILDTYLFLEAGAVGFKDDPKTTTFGSTGGE